MNGNVEKIVQEQLKWQVKKKGSRKPPLKASIHGHVDVLSAKSFKTICCVPKWVENHIDVCVKSNVFYKNVKKNSKYKVFLYATTY